MYFLVIWNGLYCMKHKYSMNTKLWGLRLFEYYVFLLRNYYLRITMIIIIITIVIIIIVICGLFLIGSFMDLRSGWSVIVCGKKYLGMVLFKEIWVLLYIFYIWMHVRFSTFLAVQTHLYMPVYLSVSLSLLFRLLWRSPAGIAPLSLLSEFIKVFWQTLATLCKTPHQRRYIFKWFYLSS